MNKANCYCDKWQKTVIIVRHPRGSSHSDLVHSSIRLRFIKINFYLVCSTHTLPPNDADNFLLFCYPSTYYFVFLFSTHNYYFALRKKPKINHFCGISFWTWMLVRFCCCLVLHQNSLQVRSLAHDLSCRLPVVDAFKGSHESTHHGGGYAGICLGDPDIGELTISEMSPDDIRAELKRYDQCRIMFATKIRLYLYDQS